MKLTYKIIAGVAATLSLVAAGTVFAQQGGWMGPGMGGPGWMGGPNGPSWMGGPGGPGMGGPGGPGWMGPGMGRMAFGMHGGWAGTDMAARAAGRTAELKVLLKITPAQETAWKAFETVVQQQASAMQAIRSQMQSQIQNPQSGAGSPDFAAQREAMFKQREASLAAHRTALRDLYAVLTPDQKVIADRSLTPMGNPRMGDWHPMR